MSPKRNQCCCAFCSGHNSGDLAARPLRVERSCFREIFRQRPRKMLVSRPNIEHRPESSGKQAQEVIRSQRISTVALPSNVGSLRECKGVRPRLQCVRAAGRSYLSKMGLRRCHVFRGAVGPGSPAWFTWDLAGVETRVMGILGPSVLHLGWDGRGLTRTFSFCGDQPFEYCAVGVALW